jgi:hypothetical protein
MPLYLSESNCCDSDQMAVAPTQSCASADVNVSHRSMERNRKDLGPNASPLGKYFRIDSERHPIRTSYTGNNLFVLIIPSTVHIIDEPRASGIRTTGRSRWVQRLRTCGFPHSPRGRAFRFPQIRAGFLTMEICPNRLATRHNTFSLLFGPPKNTVGWDGLSGATSHNIMDM